MTARRLGAAALVLLAIAAVAAWLARAPLSLGIARRVAADRLAADAIAALPEGLHVAVCGAGSPFPDERRGAPCTLVVAGSRVLLVDAGATAARTLARMDVRHARIDAVLLTHFHSDHIDGLGEVLMQRWAAGGHATPPDVHGPRGVERVVDGLAIAYANDRASRVAHHGEALVPPSGAGARARPFDTGAARRVVVIAEPDLEVVAFDVDHGPVMPAVGYRIRWRDRVVVISGDTKRADAIEREARGADLLVHDAMSMPLMQALGDGAGRAQRGGLARIFADVQDYHASPEQAADSARAAGVRALLLHHVAPPLPLLPGIEAAFMGDAPSRFAGPIRVALDGDLVTLPAGSTEVRFGRLP